MAGKKDIFDRADALPDPVTTARMLLGEEWLDEVKKTGLVGINEIESSGLVSRKTILKHCKKGLVKGDLMVVAGKKVWLFEPESVRSYLDNVIDIIENSVRKKKNRPVAVEAPDGFLKIADVAKLCNVSHWTVRDAIHDLQIPIENGKHGVKLIAIALVPEIRSTLEGKSRTHYAVGKRTVPKIAVEGRIAGGFFVPDFDLLFALLIAQPSITSDELLAATGAGLQTVVNWKTGKTINPSFQYQPGLIALFRSKFKCTLAPHLVENAKSHRRHYMREYMAKKRRNISS
jgi:hypothetical protein